METEMYKLKKEEFDLLSKVLNWENIRCDFCKTKITRDNFGLLHADVLTCNLIFCQIRGLEKLETINDIIESKLKRKTKQKVVQDRN